MVVLDNNAYRSYALCKMQAADFFTVKNFLDTQRDKLDKIEFFYPYKDEELKAALDNGIFWGLTDGDKLIATFAIDADEDYARDIANIINSCNGEKVVEKAYECSGLMVDEAYRGQGIANYLMKTAVARAEEKGIDICGVVHTYNYLSMTTFFSQSFELRGVWHLCDGYDFVYLLKRSEKVNANKKEIEVYAPLGDTQLHRDLLSKGYFGITCDEEKIGFVYGKNR